MNLTRRDGAQLTALWIVVAALRWVAALPINQPRIFRDELLHWQLARSFVLDRPFLVSGQVVDYPAVLYPLLLGPAFITTNAHLAFHAAQALNALMVSAVVFSAYALARELAEHRDAMMVAALAAMAPGGVYSALIMEENAYYPLFVLSCWLCYRVLTRGEFRDAAACAVALGLTYFAKPLAVPLVAAYTAVVLLWAVTERRAGRLDDGAPLSALATRLLPTAAFGAMLLVRHALTAHVAGDVQSSVLLSRFYSDELSGPLLPSLRPFADVILSLVAALALGTGVAPLAAMLGGWRARLADPRRLWLAVFALVVTAVYLLAAARHTILLNRAPKIHERYLFAVGPMFLALFLAAQPATLSVIAIAVAFGGLALVAALLADVALTGGTWVNAPSLTLAWLLRARMGDGIVLGLAIGAGGALACWLARRERAGFARLVRPVSLAALLVVLNASWYLFVYRIQQDLSPMAGTIRELEATTRPTDRITTVVHRDTAPMSDLSIYAKFWLDERVTVYWVGDKRPPWYADSIGPPAEAVRRTGASYLVGDPGVALLCPQGRAVAERVRGPKMPVQVIAVPASGCGPRITGSDAP